MCLGHNGAAIPATAIPVSQVQYDGQIVILMGTWFNGGTDIWEVNEVHTFRDDELIARVPVGGCRVFPGDTLNATVELRGYYHYPIEDAIFMGLYVLPKPKKESKLKRLFR